jgi:hypothetical protein
MLCNPAPVKMRPMEPDQFEDEEFELDSEAEDWDEETLGLDWDESETLSVARELGITSDF